MWQSIVAIKLDTFWKFTPEIKGDFFRLRHIEAPRNPVGWIGQAELILNTDFHQLFQIQRLNGLTTYEVIEYPKPIIFETRKLAFRQETKVPNNWIIEVEVSDMPIWNPQTPAQVTSSSANAVSVPVSTTSVQLLAANANRIDAILYNTSTKSTLYLGFGVAATVGGSGPIAPGGYFELPADYIGAINGIWNAVDANGTAKVVEFVV